MRTCIPFWLAREGQREAGSDFGLSVIAKNLFYKGVQRSSTDAGEIPLSRRMATVENDDVGKTEEPGVNLRKGLPFGPENLSSRPYITTDNTGLSHSIFCEMRISTVARLPGLKQKNAN